MALSALIGAWLAGALGGAHCLAMCGGFVAAMAGTPAATAEPARCARRTPSPGGSCPTTPAASRPTPCWAPWRAARARSALSAADLLPVQRFLYVVANLFLLALALAIAWKPGAFAWLQRAGGALFGKLVPAFRPLLRAGTVPARYALGMLWGFVPCALTYGVLPIALFAGGIWQGGAVMLAFGLGTLPNLLAAGWVMARRAAMAGRAHRPLPGRRAADRLRRDRHLARAVRPGVARAGTVLPLIRPGAVNALGRRRPLVPARLPTRHILSPIPAPFRTSEPQRNRRAGCTRWPSDRCARRRRNAPTRSSASCGRASGAARRRRPRAGRDACWRAVGRGGAASVAQPRRGVARLGTGRRLLRSR